VHGGEGADFLAVYAIADRLGKFAHEVAAMPVQELNGWLAYIDHRNQLTKENG
jgi:hypothetical protein